MPDLDFGQSPTEMRVRVIEANLTAMTAEVLENEAALAELKKDPIPADVAIWMSILETAVSSMRDGLLTMASRAQKEKQFTN